MADNVAMAKMRIDKALDALGSGNEKESFSQSCAWNVIGSAPSWMAGWRLFAAGREYEHR